MTAPVPAPEETICALATPPGRAALAVIRMSGAAAFAIAGRCFHGRHTPEETPGGRVLYGTIMDDAGGVIDDVLLSLFRGPASFTGEDTAEISCHGNPLIVSRILARLLALGARPAVPGEFTRRAWTNGRLDLARAEAVDEVIRASCQAALRGARGRLSGRLSEKVDTLRAALREASALLELELDFSQEDVEFVPRAALQDKLTAIVAELTRLIDSYRYGRVIRDGIHVAIVGPPNAGKSSLLNYFLKENRAIVSHLPGTTRDLIREEFELDGLLFILSDTAGLRESDDPVEREGVRRSRERIREADLVLLLSEPWQATAALEAEVHDLAGGVPVLKVCNKIDLGPAPAGQLGISLLQGTGLDALLDRIREAALGSWQYSEEGALIASARHRDALLRAREALTRAGATLQEGMSQEFTALELREATDALGEIVGAITPDEILDGIFAGFCIGK